MPRMITITPSRIGWRVWTYQPLFTRTVGAIRGVTEVWRRSRHAATHKLSTLVEGGDPVSPASCHHVPAFPTEVGSPVVHQASPALEEITARIGRLGGVAYRMGERRFDHLTRRIRLLRGPIPEARPEPMRHCGEALLHESSRARTMPTDRILTCRFDMTLVGRARSSD